MSFEQIIKMREILKINELFAGIGAFRKALINLGIEHQVVGISEIDKYAIKSYEAMFGQARNYGDISKIERLDYADIWTYGFPCQDISLAGLQKGIVEGETRSGLLYEVKRLLDTAAEEGTLPKYLILENVKNLVGKKFIGDFNSWIDYLGNAYNTYWKVLNAKDYGIPQNRERVFAVSIRKDIDNGTFTFPEPKELKLRLKDVLDKEVDEKYFLSEANLEWLKRHNEHHEEKGTGFKFLPKNPDEDSASCLRANGAWCPTDNAVQVESNPVNAMPDGTCRTIKNQYQKTLPANYERTGSQGATGVEAKADTRIRIRKLTPKECWRLQGFDDESFAKAKAVNSDSQLYKQAGNSICVPCLEGIMASLICQGSVINYDD